MTFSIKKKTLKKVVASLTMFATVVSMSGMMALSTVVAAEAITDGALIKSDATNPDGTPTLESLDVYIVKLVGEKSFKRLILNPTVFESYGHLNWGDIQTVSETVMGEYTTSSLVRVDTDPDEKVYAMAPDGDIGSKSWVNLTVDEFVTDAGSDPDSIYTINATDSGNYTAVGDVTTVAELTTFYSDGTLPDVEPVPAGTGLSVSLSSTTPAAATVVDNSFIEIARYNLSASSDGDVLVQSIKVTRSGVGSSSDFDAVYLYDGNNRSTSSKSVSTSTNEAEFNNVNITVSAGTTKALSLWADTISGATGNHAFRIVAASDIVTDGATVAGSFPVTGNTMSYSDQTEGYIKIQNGNTAPDPTLGEIGAPVEKFSIRAYTENATIYRMMFKQTDTADMAYLTNFGLYQASDKIADGVVDGKYITFELDAPYTIDDGLTKNFEIRADIGAKITPGNDIALNLDESVDVYAVGGTFGYGLRVDDSHAGDDVDVQGGDVTFADNGPNAGDIKDGGSDQVLLNFSITSVTDITVKDLDLAILASSNTALNLLDDIRIKNADTGVTISGPHDAVEGTNAYVKVDFSDDFNVVGGEALNLQVTADVNSSASAGDWYEVDVATATGTTNSASCTLPVIEDAEGNTITTVVPSTHIVGERMTVAEAYLTVALASTPAGQLVVKGVNDVELMGFVLEASSADTVTVNDITLKGYSTANPYDVISNVRLYNGSTDALIAGPKNISSSNDEVVFTGVDLEILAGQNVKVVVKGDVAAGLSAATSFAFDITGDTAANVGANDPGDTTSKITATDSDGSSVTVYDEDGNGDSGDWEDTDTELNDIGTLAADSNKTDANVEIEILTTGTLDLSVNADTPSAAIVVAGASDVVIAKYDFEAAYESYTVEELTVGTTSTNGVDFLSVEITYAEEDGTERTQSGYMVSDEVVFTGMTMYVPINETKTLTVKGNMNTIIGGATGADVVDLDLRLASTDTFKVTSGSGVDTNAAATSPVNEGGSNLESSDHVLYNTTIAVSTTHTGSSAAVPNSAQEVLTFKVTADSADKATLESFYLEPTGTVVLAATGNLTVYASDNPTTAIYTLSNTATVQSGTNTVAIATNVATFQEAQPSLVVGSVVLIDSINRVVTELDDPAVDLVFTVKDLDGTDTDNYSAGTSYATGTAVFLEETVLYIPLTDTTAGADVIAAGATMTYTIKGDTSDAATDATLMLSIPNTASRAFTWGDDNSTSISTRLINTFPVAGGSFKY